MKNIFKFNYNNIDYFVKKDKNKYIPYKIIDNKIIYDLEKEELVLVNYVFNKIKLTTDIIKLSNFKYLNKQYQHYYDKTNNWNIFLNLDGSNISNKEYNELNYLFNNQSDILYDNKSNKGLFERVIKYGKKTFPVIFLTVMLISPISELTPISINYDFMESTNISLQDKIDNLKDAIKNNKNLNDHEKEVILDMYEDIILNNIDLIDYDLIKDRFENLYIEYNKDVCDYDNEVRGSYCISNDTITFYSSSKIDEVKESTTCHELYHVLQEGYDHKGLNESLNNIFVNEYRGIKTFYNPKAFENSYPLLTNYMYALNEIVNPESLRHYNFKGDLSKLKKELMNIIADESKFYELIVLFDALSNSYYKKYDMDYDIVQTICLELENLLSEYYEKKYNKSMYENLEIMLSIHGDVVDKLIQIEVNKDKIANELFIFKGPINKDNLELDSFIINEDMTNHRIVNTTDIDYSGNMYFNKKNKKNNSYYKYYYNSYSSSMFYMDAIETLKNRKVINDEKYDLLKNKYELFNEGKISLDELKEFFINNIDSTYNSSVIDCYADIILIEKIEGTINKDFLKGKSNLVKELLSNNENIYEIKNNILCIKNGNDISYLDLQTCKTPDSLRLLEAKKLFESEEKNKQK